MKKTLCSLCFCLAVTSCLAANGPSRFLQNSEDWFAGEEARKIAANVLSHQSDLGGWPKNTDTTATFTGDRSTLTPTFDNGATTDELRFLARIYNTTKTPVYKEAFLKGYTYILKAQYPTGGWPQYFPPPKDKYHRHITFNDGAMVRLLAFLRETYTLADYSFLESSSKEAARAAFGRGIECILKCQIKVNGQLTAWCAQHDEIDFTPRGGRTYELPSISGAESVGIVELLMSIEHPSPAILNAVNSAMVWFESARINGIRVVLEPDPKAPKGKNKVVVKDPAAPPLWARFYEISSNRPLFVDRDGLPKYDLSEIGYERRNGYAWYGNWPQALIEKKYPAWRKSMSNDH